jgi:hypothetical protein
MGCQSCGSERLVSVNAKCNDLCQVTVGENEHVGYVPDDIGLGGGDYIEIEFCAECGQIQGDFPLQPMEIEGEL